MTGFEIFVAIVLLWLVWQISYIRADMKEIKKLLQERQTLYVTYRDNAYSGTVIELGHKINEEDTTGIK